MGGEILAAELLRMAKSLPLSSSFQPELLLCNRPAGGKGAHKGRPYGTFFGW